MGLECEPHLEVSCERKGPNCYLLARPEIRHHEVLLIGPPPLPVYRSDSLPGGDWVVSLAFISFSFW
jgi:hypothetical protein